MRTPEVACDCFASYAISIPEPANFLRRMLDENEGSGKDHFFR